MATQQILPLKFRRSSVAGYVPPVSEFTLNTFVINDNDSILFFLDGAGVVQGCPILPGLASAEIVIASAATTDLGSKKSEFLAVSGSAQIASFGSAKNQIKQLRFTGSPTLTYNAASLIIPGLKNFQVAPGDTCTVRSDANGNWTITAYQPVSGLPILPLTAPRLLTSFRNIAYNSDGKLGTVSCQFSWNTANSPSVAVFQDNSAPLGFIRNLMYISSGTIPAGSYYSAKILYRDPTTGAFGRHPVPPNATIELSANFHGGLDANWIEAACYDASGAQISGGAFSGYSNAIGAFGTANADVDTGGGRTHVIFKTPANTATVEFTVVGLTGQQMGQGFSWGYSAPQVGTLPDGSTTRSRYVEPKAATEYAPGRTGTGVFSILQMQKDRMDLRDWNSGGSLDLTGNNAETSKVQAMFDASGNEGVIGRLPSGRVNCDSTIYARYAPVIRGDKVIRQEFAVHNPLAAGQVGAELYISHSGLGIKHYDPNTGYAGRSGTILERFGTRRNQPLPSSQNQSNWQPNTAYDFDIDIWGTDITVRDVHLMNPTRGIRSSSGGRHVLENISGQPLLEGYRVEAITDTTTVRRCKWWPFWQDNASVHYWTLNNLVSYLSRRHDGGDWYDIFSIWALWALITQDKTDSNDTRQPNGATGGLTVHSMYADHTRNCLLMQGDLTTVLAFGTLQTQSYTNELSSFFGSSLVVSPTTNHHSLIGGTYKRLDINTYDCGYAVGSAMCVAGDQQQVTVKTARIGSWDRSGNNNPGMQIVQTQAQTNQFRVGVLDVTGTPTSNAPKANSGVKIGTFTTTP